MPNREAQPDTETDAALIAKSITEPQLFAVLFDRHFRDVRRYLASRVSATVADDLAAETFVAAFESRRTFDIARPTARPWLFGIAANKLGHYQRTREREQRAYARARADVAVDDLEGVEGRVVSAAARPGLLRGLRALSPDDREVLLLYAWGDLTYNEVADALEIPIGTVRSRLSRARRALSVALADGEPDDTEERLAQGGRHG